MEFLKPPKHLVMEGDLTKNWKKFRQSYELYMVATGCSSRDTAVQVATLLHVIGEEAVELYNTFEWATSETKTVKSILDKFEQYCLPKTNITVERHKFHCRCQGPTESFDSFLADLKKFSASCDFDRLKDGLIVDRIVCGINNPKVRDTLLREDKLNLEKAINICKAAELSKAHSKEINKETATEVSRVTKKIEKGPRTEKKEEKQERGRICQRCGIKHGFRCPAYNKICLACKRKGHFASVCRNKKVNEVKDTSNVDVEEQFLVGIINYNNKQIGFIDWVQEIKLVDHNEKLECKLDTGAQTNVLPLKDYKRFQLKGEIYKDRAKLQSYGGSIIKSIGATKLKCICPITEKEIYLEFNVVKTNNASDRPLLGVKTIEQLGLLKKCNKVDIVNANILDKYHDLFEGLGKLNTEHDIKLIENYVPQIVPCRKIPFQLREPLLKELNRMVKCNIITKVDEPTEWVNPIVLVRKPNNEIRICLDPQQLNKMIRREHYQLPSFEEITYDLAGANVFSVLDANKGFYHIKLSKKSTDYTTFITPFGRYKFLRLPFGLASAPEIFHREFSNIFEGIEGIKIFVDDLIIYGKNLTEHNIRLEQVLERARECGVKLNKSKCKIGVGEVKYLGHVLDKEGIKADEDKIEAIKRVPTPSNAKEVSRFLGMVTYIGKFIPNLSEHTACLRQLCKKDVKWYWSSNCEKEFNYLKELLTKTPVLQYYNEKDPIILSVDSSKEGLGAVLLQNNKPVAYGSKTLNETQKQYAQIEKETLAIVFGCERFHQYIYGKKILVESDHQPLESIFKKPLDKCPRRIQRLRIRLQCYDLEVKYKPGKLLYIADALSRASYDDKYFKLDDNEINAQINLINLSKQISQPMYDKLKNETKNDKILQKVLKYIKEGWPINKKHLDKDITMFWKSRDDLVYVNGIIYKRNALVIPETLKKEMLNKLHYNHLGINKTVSRAQDNIFWPNINNDIIQKIKKCQVCERYQNLNQKETLLNRELPHRAWEHVAVDLFHCKNIDYLLVTDYYSKFPELISLKSLTGETIINHLKNIFARHGIPTILYSDNGPQFDNHEFKNFAREWSFTHKTSSPRYAQSNGFIERQVQTIKKLVKKVIEDNKDLKLALLEYRNTPLEYNVPSPAQLLYNRQIRGIVPVSANTLKPKIYNNKDFLKNRQIRQEKYYNQHTRDLQPFKEGDVVNVYKDNKWEKGMISKEAPRPRSYRIELQSGGEVERNRKFIRQSFNKEFERDYNSEVIQNIEPENNMDKTEKTESVNGDEEEKNVQMTSVRTNTRSGRTVIRPKYLNDYEC